MTESRLLFCLGCDRFVDELVDGQVCTQCLQAWEEEYQENYRDLFKEQPLETNVDQD